MTPKLQRLLDVLGRESLLPKERLGEVTIEVPAADYLKACQKLRDHADLRFEQCVDLTGVDYAAYADKPRQGTLVLVPLPVAQEPVEDDELFLGAGSGHGELHEGKAGLLLEPLRGEQLDMGVADDGGIEGRVPPAARAGGPRPLRPHAGLGEEA